VVLLLLKRSFPVQVNDMQLIALCSTQRPESRIDSIVQDAFLDAAVLRVGGAHVQHYFVRLFDGFRVERASCKQVGQVRRKAPQLGRKRRLRWSLLLFAC
jgi:hypothetical protein